MFVHIYEYFCKIFHLITFDWFTLSVSGYLALPLRVFQMGRGSNRLTSIEELICYKTIDMVRL